MIPELGIIEGFFGPPWSWEERRTVVAALQPHGYRFYLYAPKADAFLRRRWQEPHPDAELAEIATFAAFCRQAGVRFGVGLTPFELHLEPGGKLRHLIRAKLETLAPIGIDDLAILFDDMRGDIPDLAQRHAAIVDVAAGQGVASRILCCPSYYSDDPVLDRAFGQRPHLYLEDLGRLLDPTIEIMWTGEEVCSREISIGHLAKVAEQIGRRPFLWDNYPVNDGPRMSQHLHLRGVTGRPARIGPHIAAHGVNPALQPWLSLPPAVTLSMSYRAGDAYSYGAAWDEAAWSLFGDELARRLRADLLTFHDRGLDRIGPNRKAELRDIYSAFDHPAAREVIAWLAGAYDVSDEMVQTQ
ncbi:MAG TPA: beta-N-acetylglucosaminidase domain-containing protein [Allosphingosinicella sp.]|uniref:beta-N-acetylglucosaminidase domain-containing protein n=1 Tax=Allosphingosinicella sp. TaxID=2823234 RepID=UPI002F2776D3